MGRYANASWADVNGAMTAKPLDGLAGKPADRLTH